MGGWLCGTTYGRLPIYGKDRHIRLIFNPFGSYSMYLFSLKVSLKVELRRLAGERRMSYFL